MGGKRLVFGTKEREQEEEKRAFLRSEKVLIWPMQDKYWNFRAEARWASLVKIHGRGWGSFGVSVHSIASIPEPVNSSGVYLNIST